jgi:hypothetical protein
MTMLMNHQLRREQELGDEIDDTWRGQLSHATQQDDTSFAPTSDRWSKRRGRPNYLSENGRSSERRERSMQCEVIIGVRN